MNIALPALVVFVLLLPGFIVRSRFKRAERASIDYSPFGQVVAEAVVWASVFHAMWLAVAYGALGQRLQTSVLMGLLSSEPGTQSQALRALALADGQVACYFLTLIIAAYVLPSLARRAIVRWRLDRQGSPVSPWTRFHGAPWYYLLSGADFEDTEVPDLIQVSALVSVGKEPMLYTGVLEDYFCDDEGQLDRLVLSNTMRRALSADKPLGGDQDPARFYPIEGDYFVLRYSEAITLNIRYVRLLLKPLDGQVGAPASVPT